MSVYGWGSNAFAQVLPHKEVVGDDAVGDTRTLRKAQPAVFTPTELLLDDGGHDLDMEALSVAAGEAHSLVLTSSGDVLSYGKGNALGRSETQPDRLVHSLSHETVVAVAAGSLTSFAITASGKVYQWGLIHDREKKGDTGGDYGKEDEDDEEDEDPSAMAAAASAGALVGLAQDQGTTIIAADTEARASVDTTTTGGTTPSSAAPPAGGGAAAGSGPGGRTLGDLLARSRDTFTQANDGADEEYARELRAMGYKNEDVRALRSPLGLFLPDRTPAFVIHPSPINRPVRQLEKKMQDRGREYQGMAKMGCLRRPQPTPQLIRLPRKVRVTAVAAGYAHTMPSPLTPHPSPLSPAPHPLPGTTPRARPHLSPQPLSCSLSLSSLSLPLPRQVRVTAVAAGYAHTMLVTADAQLYGTCL